jgi:syntaxin 1B/2/3
MHRVLVAKGMLSDQLNPTANSEASRIKVLDNQSHGLRAKVAKYIESYREAIAAKSRVLLEKTVLKVKLLHTKEDGTTISDNEARELAQKVMETDNTYGLFVASREQLDEVLETRTDIMRIERSMRDIKQMTDD